MENIMNIPQKIEKRTTIFQSMGSQRFGLDWATEQQQQKISISQHTHIYIYFCWTFNMFPNFAFAKDAARNSHVYYFLYHIWAFPYCKIPRIGIIVSNLQTFSVSLYHTKLLFAPWGDFDTVTLSAYEFIFFFTLALSCCFCFVKVKKIVLSGHGVLRKDTLVDD